MDRGAKQVMDDNILIYIQEMGEEIEPVSLELLGKGEELSRESGLSLYGVCIGVNAKKMHRLLRGYPLEKLYYYETLSACMNTNYAAEVTANLCRMISPRIFLIGATRYGRSLAPCIAARLKTGLTADCTELHIDKAGELLQIRPAFEEQMLAHIKTRTRPQMATVRPGVMDLPLRNMKKAVGPELIIERAEQEKNIKTQGSYEILDRKPVQKTDEINISEEKLLVVAGAGVTNRDDIEMLEQWAKSMGGTIACSRKLVERGWFTVERQVGLSGNASRAEVMITVGVSGSVQFQAGIHKVKHLIAVNTDPDAPIMDLADRAVLSDLHILIQSLKTSDIERN